MSKKTGSLKTYKSKRNFSKTTEPKGKVKKIKSKKPIFVIQKHAASHLHYDLRLEIDGVLKSWAVPKGPSTDPSVKRLAAETEDHPMDYANFEGVIPEGQYGGGTVMVWDNGTYENIKKDKDGKTKPMDECFKDGQIEVKLNGKKIKGAYALVKMKNKEKNWLLIKMRDEEADARRNPTSTENKSILTNRTLSKSVSFDGSKSKIILSG